MTSLGDPLVGQVLDGRYQITTRLARGGMATVYQAVDTRLTRTVAVKVMHVGLGDEEEFADKFDREARAAARLSHPNVVSVFDQGRAVLDGHILRPYIVMEYVAGPTLRDLIVREAPMAPLRALEVLEPVLAALAAAHDAGLVHRDVKPENVLISDRGQIKVADFGLAKAISSQTSTATQGLLIGTVSYLPPELVISGRADARSDVYSAGVVLFELLTGRKPHTGETPIQVAYAHVHTDVPAPSTVAPTAGIPPYLDALVTGATARDPAARPRDARVLLALLRRVRSALRSGLGEDAELTADLTAVRSGRPAAADPDVELTQRVPTPTRPDPAVAALPAPPRYPTPGHGVAPTGAPGSPNPTLRDAPPPAAAPRHAPPQPSPSGLPGDRTVAARPLAAPRPRPGDRAVLERERAGRRRRRGWLVLLLVLLLTTAAAVTGWYLTEGRFTSAPALGSLSRAEATRVAERAGLRLRVVDAYSETVPRGQVISTDPGPGTKVPDGGEIDAVVSRGPERYPMPSVVGLSRSAAATILSLAHLTTGEVSGRWSDTAPRDTVLKTSARAGASLKPQTAVDLTLSRGPRPVPVPDWTGKPADAAVRALEKAGFAVVAKSENSDTVPAGQVVAQTPSSGTGTKGDPVTLTRSLGPVLVTVPNVRLMTVAAAEQVMGEAGFSTVVEGGEGRDLSLGLVTSTDPAARSQAPHGATITLHVV